MLEKILKIVKTIDSCKFIHQLEQCVEVINNFERDEKPFDSRIVEGLLKVYRIRLDDIPRKKNIDKWTFEDYLIMVGIRSLEYSHTDKTLFNNKEYFKRCFRSGLSAYKALLFLQDYIEGDYII